MKEEQPPASAASVPEASPEMNEKEAATAPASRRNLYYLLGGVALVIVLVLCIALPLDLKDSGSSSSSSTEDPFLDAEESLAGNDAGNAGGDKPGSSTTSRDGDEPGTADGNGGAGTATFVSADSTLPLFGSSITSGYTGDDEVERALIIAFRQQAQTIIDQNLRNYQQQKEWEATRETVGGGGGAGQVLEESANFAAMPEGGDMAMADSDAGGAAPASAPEGVTDFETNNQEENIDEADMIKADANFVYGAYGVILIWDTAGNQVAQVQMPPIELPESPQQPSKPQVAEQAKKSLWFPDHVYKPKPNINSMLLTDNHLIVLVDGYNNQHYYWAYEMESQIPRPMLYAHRACQIRVYQKTATGNLTFVASKDVNGNFVDARSIGDVVHLATSSGVDTWTHLGSPLDWWQISNGTNIDEVQYQTLANRLADKLVPELSRQLMDEMRLDNGELPTLLQINQWFTQVNETEGDEDNNGKPGFDLPYHQSYDVVSNVGQVTSFDVTAPLTEEGELTTSASAYMAPSYFNTLYGTEDHLVLATAGWDWNPMLGEGEQTTYVVALEIDGPSTSFLSVGTLKGHLLNQYALDIVDGELRAATTVERFNWWWGPIRPMPFDAVDVAMSEPVEAAEGGGRRRRLNDPDGLCPTPEEDGCVNDDNYAECLALVEDGCSSIAIMESCPLQFGCNGKADGEEAPGDEPIIDEPDVFPPPPPPSDESRTENYIVVLRLVGDTPGQMTEKGRVQIGEKHERITSVRFFDNVAYAVTFERTDPFYVLDMSVPEVLGELKLPGFSSYLHSMNADNTLLLAVGQNATENGRETGLMVTVFDATDASNPKALVSHTFENDDNAYSGSSVQWDYKAFRYVDGKLVVPLEIWYHQEWDPVTQQLLPLPEGAENFRGFAVLDVTTTAITEQYRISHMKDPGSCFYCNGYLPQRSFVYSGDLMTVQENIVVSTGLHSGEEKWRFNIEVQGETAECCW